MKHKKTLTALVFALALFMAFTLGVYAADGLQEISAYLNSNITIKLDGETKTLTDATGARTYPITYNGTTYVPLRAVANLLGINVDWDQATQSVLLGESKGDVVDLIDAYKAYALTEAGQVQSSEGMTESIGGVEVNHRLFLWSGSADMPEAHFNLGGKYTSLTFQVYAPENDVTLEVYGDNGAVLAEIPVTGSAVPKTVTVPLFNTTELFFTAAIKEFGVSCYIFDAKLS